MVGRRNTLLVTKRSLRNSDGATGKRPRRIIQTKVLDDTVGMSRREEQELNKALYASLQETRRTKSMPALSNHASSSGVRFSSKSGFKSTRSHDSISTAATTAASSSSRVNHSLKSNKLAVSRRQSLRSVSVSPTRQLRRSGSTASRRSRHEHVSPTRSLVTSSITPAASLNVDESSQDSVKSSASSQTGSKRKIHAQRKFAQGCSLPGMVSCTPTRTVTPAVKMLSSKIPKTEDFLTFLCLRGSSILPPHLDFFNFSREEMACRDDGSKPASSPSKVKHLRESTPDSSSTSSGANEEVAEAAFVSTPSSMADRSGSSLLAKRSAARASAGTPETARGIVSLRQGLQRKVSTSSSSSSSARFTNSSPCLPQVSGLTNTPPSRYRNKFYFTPEKSPSPSKASGIRPGEFTPPSVFSSTLHTSSMDKVSPLICHPSQFVSLTSGSHTSQCSSSSSSSSSSSTRGAFKRKRRMTIGTNAMASKVTYSSDSSPSFDVSQPSSLEQLDCLASVMLSSLPSSPPPHASLSSSVSNSSFLVSSPSVPDQCSQVVVIQPSSHLPTTVTCPNNHIPTTICTPSSTPLSMGPPAGQDSATSSLLLPTQSQPPTCPCHCVFATADHCSTAVTIGCHQPYQEQTTPTLSSHTTTTTTTPLANTNLPSHDCLYSKTAHTQHACSSYPCTPCSPHDCSIHCTHEWLHPSSAVTCMHDYLKPNPSKCLYQSISNSDSPCLYHYPCKIHISVPNHCGSASKSGHCSSSQNCSRVGNPVKILHCACASRKVSASPRNNETCKHHCECVHEDTNNKVTGTGGRTKISETKASSSLEGGDAGGGIMEQGHKGPGLQESPGAQDKEGPASQKTQKCRDIKSCCSRERISEKIDLSKGSEGVAKRHINSENHKFGGKKRKKRKMYKRKSKQSKYSLVKRVPKLKLRLVRHDFEENPDRKGETWKKYGSNPIVTGAFHNRGEEKSADTKCQGDFQMEFLKMLQDGGVNSWSTSQGAANSEHEDSDICCPSAVTASQGDRQQPVLRFQNTFSYPQKLQEDREAKTLWWAVKSSAGPSSHKTYTNVKRIPFSDTKSGRIANECQGSLGHKLRKPPEKKTVRRFHQLKLDIPPERRLLGKYLVKNQHSFHDETAQTRAVSRHHHHHHHQNLNTKYEDGLSSSDNLALRDEVISAFAKFNRKDIIVSSIQVVKDAEQDYLASGAAEVVHKEDSDSKEDQEEDVVCLGKQDECHKQHPMDKPTHTSFVPMGKGGSENKKVSSSRHDSEKKVKGNAEAHQSDDKAGQILAGSKQHSAPDIKVISPPDTASMFPSNDTCGLATRTDSSLVTGPKEKAGNLNVQGKEEVAAEESKQLRSEKLSADMGAHQENSQKVETDENKCVQDESLDMRVTHSHSVPSVAGKDGAYHKNKGTQTNDIVGGKEGAHQEIFPPDWKEHEISCQPVVFVDGNSSQGASDITEVKSDTKEASQACEELLDDVIIVDITGKDEKVFESDDYSKGHALDLSNCAMDLTVHSKRKRAGSGSSSDSGVSTDSRSDSSCSGHDSSPVYLNLSTSTNSVQSTSCSNSRGYNDNQLALPKLMDPANNCSSSSRKQKAGLECSSHLKKVNSIIASGSSGSNIVNQTSCVHLCLDPRLPPQVRSTYEMVHDFTNLSLSDQRRSKTLKNLSDLLPAQLKCSAVDSGPPALPINSGTPQLQIEQSEQSQNSTLKPQLRTLKEQFKKFQSVGAALGWRRNRAKNVDKAGKQNFASAGSGSDFMWPREVTMDHRNSIFGSHSEHSRQNSNGSYNTLQTPDSSTMARFDCSRTLSSDDHSTRNLSHHSVALDDPRSSAIVLHSYGSLNTGQGFAMVNGQLQQCEILDKRQISHDPCIPSLSHAATQGYRNTREMRARHQEAKSQRVIPKQPINSKAWKVPPDRKNGLNCWKQLPQNVLPPSHYQASCNCTIDKIPRHPDTQPRLKGCPSCESMHVPCFHKSGKFEQFKIPKHHPTYPTLPTCHNEVDYLTSSTNFSQFIVRPGHAIGLPTMSSELQRKSCRPVAAFAQGNMCPHLENCDGPSAEYYLDPRANSKGRQQLHSVTQGFLPTTVANLTAPTVPSHMTRPIFYPGGSMSPHSLPAAPSLGSQFIPSQVASDRYILRSAYESDMELHREITLTEGDNSNSCFPLPYAQDSLQDFIPAVISSLNLYGDPGPVGASAQASHSSKQLNRRKDKLKAKCPRATQSVSTAKSNTVLKSSAAAQDSSSGQGASKSYTSDCHVTTESQERFVNCNYSHKSRSSLPASIYHSELSANHSPLPLTASLSASSSTAASAHSSSSQPASYASGNSTAHALSSSISRHENMIISATSSEMAECQLPSDLFLMSDLPEAGIQEENVLDVIMSELKAQIAMLKEEISRESQGQAAAAALDSSSRRWKTNSEGATSSLLYSGVRREPLLMEPRARSGGHQSSLTCDVAEKDIRAGPVAEKGNSLEVSTHLVNNKQPPGCAPGSTMDVCIELSTDSEG